MTNATLSKTNPATQTHPLWVEVDLGKLRSNLDKIRSQLKPETGILSVVKADAYGHGLVPCAKALEGFSEMLGVTDVVEAIRLREAGLSKPILVFGFWRPEDLEWVVRTNLRLTLSDGEQAAVLNEYVAQNFPQKKITVHLKIDTGMNRLGFPFAHAVREILKLQDLTYLECEGIFTHFAEADEKGSLFTSLQLSRFLEVVNPLKEAGHIFRWHHAANSAGLHHFPNAHFNLVRPGISLYGINRPGAGGSGEPVLSWKTRVKFIKHLEPGETVSYGRLYQAHEPTRIAVLPVGYNHGYPYALSSKAWAVIKGKRYPVVGQVCMDYTMVNIGPEEEAMDPVRLEDEVILIGGSPEDVSVTVSELADWANTIPYEIATGILPSIPRVYTE